MKLCQSQWVDVLREWFKKGGAQVVPWLSEGSVWGQSFQWPSRGLSLPAIWSRCQSSNWWIAQRARRKMLVMVAIRIQPSNMLRQSICALKAVILTRASLASVDTSSCSVGIPKGDVTGYQDVQADDVNALMEAVVQQPVAISVDANSKGWKLYKSGVITAKCGTKLDHAVLLVGYGTMNGTAYWKVKNSWNTDWGMDGYVLIERGVKSSGGMCGIRAEPTYPIVSSKSPTPAPPSPSPPSPPKTTCCFSSDSTCQAGQLCCSASQKSYASEATCKRHGAKHHCSWDAAKSECVVKSSIFVV